MPIPASLDTLVRQRARERCEYCHMPQAVRRLRFSIDHIVARKHGGPTEADNLALCCGQCNLHKGTDLSGIDPLTGRMSRLFHPRRDRWGDHFRWEGLRIVGTTPVGRVTAIVLQLNRETELPVREELFLQGLLPDTGGVDA
jgi:HNH endonuclease